MVCHWGKIGQRLKQKPLNAPHWFVLHAMLGLLFYTTQGHLHDLESLRMLHGVHLPAAGKGRVLQDVRQ